MILGEGISERPGAPVLFMLSLLEVGAVAILLALLRSAITPVRSHLPASRRPQVVSTRAHLSSGCCCSLVLAPSWACCRSTSGFSGRLWFGQRRYGVIFSGVVLNCRILCPPHEARGNGCPRGNMGGKLRDHHVIAGVLTAILADLQCIPGRGLATHVESIFAENASVAIAVLGASLLFLGVGLPGSLRSRGWYLLHMAGHSLSKSTLFLARTASIPSMQLHSSKPGCCEIRPSSWYGALFAT